MIEVHLQAIPDDMALAAEYAEGALGKPVSETVTLDAVGWQISRRLLPNADTLAKVMRGACPERSRRKAHLHRQYIQTLHELEAIQVRRQGGHSPLARLDVSAPPMA